MGAIRHDEIGIIEACRGGHEFCVVGSRVSREVWVADFAWFMVGKRRLGVDFLELGCGLQGAQAIV